MVFIENKTKILRFFKCKNSLPTFVPLKHLKMSVESTYMISEIHRFPSSQKNHKNT